MKKKNLSTSSGEKNQVCLVLLKVHCYIHNAVWNLHEVERGVVFVLLFLVVFKFIIYICLLL